MNTESWHSGPGDKLLDGRSGPTSTPQLSMTLREYYAGLAMQGLLAHGDFPGYTVEETAKHCRRLAEALIAELDAYPV